MKVERDTLIVAVVVIAAGFVGWLLWKKLANINQGTPYEGSGVVGTLGNGVNAALGGLPAAAGSGLGGFLYDFTHDQAAADAAASNVDYIVTFPDSSRHAVNATAVDSSGYFSYQGQAYRLGSDSSGRRVAVAG